VTRKKKQQKNKEERPGWRSEIWEEIKRKRIEENEREKDKLTF